MISFQKQPIGTLDVASGQLTGVPGMAKTPKPADIGMDTKEFHSQVIRLAQGGIPLKKALGAIDQHPDITDKPKAKEMATAVYDIIGAPQKNMAK